MVVFQHPTDISLPSGPFCLTPSVCTGLPRSFEGQEKPSRPTVHIRDEETKAQRGQVTRLSFHSRTWLGPRMSSLELLSSERLGGSSASLFHMPGTSLAVKVIGRKLGFLKVREGDDRVGRSVSTLLPAQPPFCLAARETAVLSLSFLAPEKPSLPPLFGESMGGSRPCLPPKPKTLCLCGCPLLPCHLAFPGACGIRGRRGIRFCKWLPPSRHPASLS